MKYKPYPKYKKTHINSLGEVPEGWMVKGLRYICQLRYGEPLSFENRDEEGAVAVFGSNGMVGTHSVANTYEPVIIIGRKGSFGKINYSPKPVYAIDTTYFIDSRYTKENLNWLKYALKTLNLDVSSKDSAIPGIAKEDIYDNKLPLPSLPEQKAIASFLDLETTRIETLIDKKNLLIEKLREKRFALIYSVVTQGLPSEVAESYAIPSPAHFKKSGVSWIEKIPQAWGVRKLATIAQLRSGESITSEDIAEGGAFPVYGGNGLRGYYNRYTHDGTYILIGRQGALCGNIHCVEGKFWASEHTFIVTPTVPFDTSWLAAQLTALDLNRFAISAAQPGLTAEQISSLKIPFPPLPEQKAIADYLNRETNKIDVFITKIEEAVVKLGEYSDVLINATITGKIDVREYTSYLGVSDLKTKYSHVSECLLPDKKQKVA